MSSAPKSAQNFVRFKFGEFIANYLSADTRKKRSPYCLMGKAFNDVAAKKEKAKNVIRITLQWLCFLKG